MLTQKSKKRQFIIVFALLSSMLLNVFFVREHISIQKTKNVIKHALVKLGLRKKPVSSSHLMQHDKPFVYHAFLDSIRLIPPTTFQDSTSELPGMLIITPGRFTFYGNTYDLQQEGLYRFVYPQKENQQRIVYYGNIDALLSSLSWIVSHGNSDHSKSYDELTLKATNSKLFINCGVVSDWGYHILSTQNKKSRPVRGLTLEEWNSYDNTHRLIEVYREKHHKWVLYDLDNNACFYQDETPLSLIEFSDLSASGEYRIQYLSNDNRLDVSNFLAKSTNYDYVFVAERLIDEHLLKKWYKRVMQVPMILDNDKFYFFDENNRSRIESHLSDCKYVDKDRFIKMFYDLSITQSRP